MGDLSDEQRKILARAKENEDERIEIYAQAMEERVADLLPTSFSNFDAEMEDPVEIRLTLGVTAHDIEAWGERECRNFAFFIAGECDRARQERNL